jgi:hypothetical protein
MLGAISKGFAHIHLRPRLGLGPNVWSFDIAIPKEKQFLALEPSSLFVVVNARNNFL